MFLPIRTQALSLLKQKPQTLLTIAKFPALTVTKPFTKPSPSPPTTITRTFTTTMSAPQDHSGTSNFTGDSSVPGESFEARQTAPSDDYKPDPSKSLPLSPARQSLVDDVIALYSCQPTVERVKRYTPDCVYDDQFVYANDRYKMAGQWFALPKLFKQSINEGYQVVVNDKDLIQFKNEQVSSLFPHPLLPSPFPIPILTFNKTT